MIVMIFVTQNNFQNGPGIFDRLLGFYPELSFIGKNAHACALGYQSNPFLVCGGWGASVCRRIWLVHLVTVTLTGGFRVESTTLFTVPRLFTGPRLLECVE